MENNSDVCLAYQDLNKLYKNVIASAFAIDALLELLSGFLFEGRAFVKLSAISGFGLGPDKRSDFRNTIRQFTALDNFIAIHNTHIRSGAMKGLVIAVGGLIGLLSSFGIESRFESGVLQWLVFLLPARVERRGLGVSIRVHRVQPIRSLVGHLKAPGSDIDLHQCHIAGLVLSARHLVSPGFLIHFDKVTHTALTGEHSVAKCEGYLVLFY